MIGEGARRRRPPRRLPGGARTRILAAIIVLLAFSTLVSTFALREILIGQVETRIDDQLTRKAQEISRLARETNPPPRDADALFNAFLRRNLPARGEAVLTFSRDGVDQAQTLPRNRIAQLRPLFGLRTATDTRRGTRSTPAGDFRYLAVPVIIRGRRQGVFVAAAELGGERSDVDDAVRVAEGVSIGVLAVASLIAFSIMGRVLAPLRQLRDTARAITESDLTRRIEVQGSDEIAELGHTFNEMLDRLERAFATQRSFVSDAGHELRTPITIIRGHLELMGHDPFEREETLEIVTDELDRMTRFVDDLLLLAKAERGDFLLFGDLDVDVLTEELLAKATGLADRDWRLESSAAGRLTGDRQRLTQAVMQLAANAAQHTDTGDRIGLGSAVVDGHVRLWVSDSGPGVPAGEEERIFERFARAGDTRRRSEGAGLGLAIVRVIAEGHGGSVEVRNGDPSSPYPGATFTVVVPSHPHDAEHEEPEVA